MQFLHRTTQQHSLMLHSPSSEAHKTFFCMTQITILEKILHVQIARLRELLYKFLCSEDIE